MTLLSHAGSQFMVSCHHGWFAGPRVCLGESLARMEIFILFSTLVQFYTFTMPGQGQKPDLQGQMGITFAAKNQSVVATLRHWKGEENSTSYPLASNRRELTPILIKIRVIFTINHRDEKNIIFVRVPSHVGSRPGKFRWLHSAAN